MSTLTFDRAKPSSIIDTANQLIGAITPHRPTRRQRMMAKARKFGKIGLPMAAMGTAAIVFFRKRELINKDTTKPLS
jgi:hypothetical protein